MSLKAPPSTKPKASDSPDGTDRSGDDLSSVHEQESGLYKRRFESVSRVAKKVAVTFEIGDILETLRDEAKAAIPAAKEACLLVLDPDAAHYTRPLHCAIHKERINCQLCKRGKKSIGRALKLSREPSEAGAPAKIKTGGEMVVPLVHEGATLAVLHLMATPGETFTFEDEVILDDLAGLATQLIVTSKAHWQVKQEKLTTNRILEQIKPFVPKTVQKLIEKDPQNPALGKRDVHVSILFLDVAGYTLMGESLSREQVRFIIEKYFSSFVDIIYRHGGDINETAGDGLMVIFSGAQDENARDAAQAALEIREETERINRELTGRFRPVIINMGINSGVASVGMTRFEGAVDKRMTYTASGAVTNLAARIAASAREGEILLGPETTRLVASHLEVEPRGAREFKNVKEPTPVHRLVGPK